MASCFNAADTALLGTLSGVVGSGAYCQKTLGRSVSYALRVFRQYSQQNAPTQKISN